MNKNIQEFHKLIIDAGSSGDTTKLDIREILDYHHLATELLYHPLPVGKENRCDFLKGLVLLENILNLGSTSPFYNFMKRFDLYNNVELMDWIFANRNNPYIPFGSFRPPLEVRSYSQYLEYEKKHQEYREKIIGLDIKRSRLAKERKNRIREEHKARKKANTEKQKLEILNYEIRMFRETCNQLNFQEGTSFEIDLLFESLAIHTRLLIEFFYNDKKKYKDDLIAQDFLPNTIDWKTQRPPKTRLLKNAQYKANKQLAHISLCRIEIAKNNKEWDWNGISRDMEIIIDKFEILKNQH